MLMMMVVNGDAVDARGDEGDDDFAGDNASGGDEESCELFPTSSASAWWPGGRTRANPFESCHLRFHQERVGKSKKAFLSFK